jgi:pimeloyl-ACP methyl ester carboxylesterase
VTGQVLPPLRSTNVWRTPRSLWSYDCWGQHGRPLILIPALMFDRVMWWPAAADLRPHATVIAVDLPGHGASTRRSRYDPYDIVDDLAALIAHLGVPQAPLVVGHGLSAGLAALFATRYATHAVVTVDGDTAVSADPDRYLSDMGLDVLPERYRDLITPGDPRMLHEYAACMGLLPSAPSTGATRYARLAVHSRTPSHDERASGWRHEVHDVPGRFPHLADVGRFVADVQALLRPHGPAPSFRREGQ